MNSRIYKAVSVSAVTLLLAVGLVSVAVDGAQAGDFARFPEYTAEVKEEVDIAELKKLLHQARELRETQEAAAREQANLAAVAAPGKAAPEDGGEAAPEAEAKLQVSPAAETPPPTQQAGCMYRANKLIWERVAGTCSP
jgi:hypothetical protein